KKSSDIEDEFARVEKLTSKKGKELEDAVVEVLRSKGIDCIALCGHSFGHERSSQFPMSRNRWCPAGFMVNRIHKL
ncbi:45999_t:CDS:2, partial [Gigaspora margarita]